MSEDIKLETDGEYFADEDTPVNPDAGSYQPRVALNLAITDWLEEFLTPCDKVKTKMVCMSSVSAPISTTVNACSTTLTSTVSTIQPQCSTTPVSVEPLVTNLNSVANPLDVVNDPFAQPTSLVGPVNSLVDPLSSESEADSASEGVPEEPMDCIVTPGTSPVLNSCIEANIPVPITENTQIPLAPVDSMDAQVDGPTMPEDPVEDAEGLLKLTPSDISLLVDLFYLPFEHGFQGCSMLCELHWLKVNAHTPTEAKSATATEEQIATANDWRDRCEKFHAQVAAVRKLYEKLCSAPNQAIHSDLHPYMWDIVSTLTLVDSYVSWLGTLAFHVLICLISNSLGLGVFLKALSGTVGLLLENSNSFPKIHKKLGFFEKERILKK